MSVLAFPPARDAETAPGASVPSAPAARLSYLDHFGLAAAPFGLTPDSAFYFASTPHQDALSTLLYALENGEGFIKIVGAVGTGKTLLCRTLLSTLPVGCRAAYLPNPALKPLGILHALAEELEIAEHDDDNEYRLHKAIQTRLLELASEHVHVVLVIDEAQAMPLESLETVRLLSNLETEKRKLLTIVLFGQPELDARLNAVPQLKTRISFHDRLSPLSRAELATYLDHRMQCAGSAGGQSRFTAGAVRVLYATSGGVPRIAHVIAHKALLLAYGRGLHRVGVRETWTAARDTLAAKRWSPWTLLAMLVLATVAAAAVWLARTSGG